ncbi:MAG: GntR family transcriptional regulator [Clostridia bacterium]|nr:GntR family transcriptional regulator [Clostridia bacterium]
MAWQFNNTEPVFLQIANKLRTDILNGKYSPDEQIPSVRQLAFDASVNPNTMQKALTFLEEEGLLYTRGTVGRFVTSDSSVIDNARERVKRSTVRTWLTSAKALGISTQELINYIKEEDTL